MKNYKLLLSAIACGALLALSPKATAADEMGYMTVSSVEGSASYSIDGGHVWHPLVIGKYLAPGTIMKTGDDSSVDLLVGKTYADKVAKTLQFNTSRNPAPNVVPTDEKNMIRLRPNSVIAIDKLMVPEDNHYKVSDTELDLQEGDIIASVQKVSPSAQYLIKLPNGVAAVRGTTFSLGAGHHHTGEGGGASVASGTVWLTISVTDPATGKPITQPDGQPFAPVPITLNAGQSLSLTTTVLSQLATILVNTATTIAQLQSNANQVGATQTQKLIDNALTAALTTVAQQVGTQIAQIAPTVLQTIAQVVAQAGTAPVVVVVAPVQQHVTTQ